MSRFSKQKTANLDGESDLKPRSAARKKIIIICFVVIWENRNNNKLKFNFVLNILSINTRTRFCCSFKVFRHCRSIFNVFFNKNCFFFYFFFFLFQQKLFFFKKIFFQLFVFKIINKKCAAPNPEVYKFDSRIKSSQNEVNRIKPKKKDNLKNFLFFDVGLVTIGC